MPEIEAFDKTSSQSANPSFGIEALVGDRKSVEEIAKAANSCVRTINDFIDENGVPYVKFNRKRYCFLEDLQKALASREKNSPPRGPGRPRKIRSVA